MYSFSLRNLITCLKLIFQLIENHFSWLSRQGSYLQNVFIASTNIYFTAQDNQVPNLSVPSLWFAVWTMRTLVRGFLAVSFLDQLSFGYCLRDLDLQCKYFRNYKVSLLLDKRFQTLALSFPKIYIKLSYDSGRLGMLLLRTVEL